VKISKSMRKCEKNYSGINCDAWDLQEEEYCLANKTDMKHNFFCMFISILHMFRATMCPSSGEITVSMRNLGFVTLKKVNSFILTCFRVTNTKCRIDTVISPDDGHIVARNM